MPDLLLFDRFRVNLLLPPGAHPDVTDAISTALEDPAFLDAVRRAVQALLDATPALVALTARAEW